MQSLVLSDDAKVLLKVPHTTLHQEMALLLKSCESSCDFILRLFTNNGWIQEIQIVKYIYI